MALTPQAAVGQRACIMPGADTSPLDAQDALRHQAIIPSPTPQIG